MTYEEFEKQFKGKVNISNELKEKKFLKEQFTREMKKLDDAEAKERQELALLDATKEDAAIKKLGLDEED